MWGFAAVVAGLIGVLIVVGSEHVFKVIGGRRYRFVANIKPPVGEETLEAMRLGLGGSGAEFITTHSDEFGTRVTFEKTALESKELTLNRPLAAFQLPNGKSLELVLVDIKEV